MKTSYFTSIPAIHSLMVISLCLSAMTGVSMGQSSENSGGDAASELRQVGLKFQEVHNQIHEIQVKAGETKAVQKAEKEFAEAMNKAMLKLDPEIKEDLERSNELLKKIRNHPNIDDPRAREQDLELKKMLLDYRYLERNMGDLRKEAAKEPKCKDKFEKLQKTIVEEMKKIDPNTQELMDRKEKLAAQYRELRKQVN